MTTRVWRTGFVAAFGLSICAVGSAHSEVRALIIGIDAYQSKQHLRGSVNDAYDVSRVLASGGVSDLTVLTDADATKVAFEGEWRDMVARTQPGDILLLTFSGHGIRVPVESDTRYTPDGYEKGFLLYPYNEKSRPDELLRDEDLYDLFGAATSKGAKIVLLADACHSGAAVRAVDPRVGPVPFRFQRFQTEAAPTTPPKTVDRGRPPNPSVTVLSATDERLSIQEVIIDGAYRGALSYAFARGLEGAASDDKGVVTAAALRQFISPMVRTLSANRQIPQFALPEPALEILDADVDPVEAPADLKNVSLAIIGDGEESRKFDGATIVADRSAADLIWDCERRQLLNSSGDVLASRVSLEEVQGGIDARRVLNALRHEIASQHGPVSAVASVDDQIVPEGGFLEAGMSVRLTVRPDELRFVTMLNLSATGVVQFLWPLADRGEPAEWASSSPLSFSSLVGPPFGADFVITILSDRPLAELQETLRDIHKTISPLKFHDALQKASLTAEVRVGVEGLYSCERLRSNEQCETMLAQSP